jgi:glucose/arabinose dehydrogenase
VLSPAPGPESRGANRAATATVLLGARDASSAVPAGVVDSLAAAEATPDHHGVVADVPGGEGVDAKADAERGAELFASLLEPGSHGGTDAISGDADASVEDVDRFSFVAAPSGGSGAGVSAAGTNALAASTSPAPPVADAFVFSGAIGDSPGLLAAGGTLQAELIVSGLASPVFAASPPGDPDRLFVIEKDSGRVLIVDLDTNQVLPQPFFDVPAAEMTNDGERGLLGLAFHPDYAANGKLYLNLTNEVGDTEIWELTRSANPDLADPASLRVLLTVPRDPALSNHNGGWIGFGPDGLLYIATGDGGGGNDPANNAQNINDLRGKMLRIDVDGDDFPADAGRNYAIPAGNPFVGVNGADEVFAYGLRNPFRASFDSLTGDFYIADVGEGRREEVDFLQVGTGAGTNFGWRVMEGTLPTGLPQAGNPPPGDPSLRLPILDYGPETSGSASQAIIGGYVYRGPGGGQGLYFFADIVNNQLWTLRVENGQAFDFARRNGEVVTSAGELDQIASFAVDGSERLYAVGLDGEIFRLTPSEDFGPVPEQQGGGEGNPSELVLALGLMLGAAALLF